MDIDKLDKIIETQDAINDNLEKLLTIILRFPDIIDILGDKIDKLIESKTPKRKQEDDQNIPQIPPVMPPTADNELSRVNNKMLKDFDKKKERKDSFDSTTI